MRNMFIALVLSVVSLSALAEIDYIGSWGYDIYKPTAIVKSMNGETSSVSLHVHTHGSVSITWMKYDDDGRELNFNTARRSNQVVNVNGQNVNFQLTFYDNGYITASPISRDGELFIIEQAKKARALDFSGKNWGVTFSAEGFKKAWSFIQSKKAI